MAPKKEPEPEPEAESSAPDPMEAQLVASLTVADLLSDTEAALSQQQLNATLVSKVASDASYMASQ